MYNTLLTLHILAVVVGIGSQTLNGVYAAKAKSIGGPGQGAVMKANFDVSMIAEKVIYLIPIFGLALVGVGHDDYGWSLGQTWLWLSLVLYVVALGIAHGVMVPSAKKMQALGAKFAAGQGGPADGAQAAKLEKMLATGGMVLNLLLVVLIALMIWKPGV